MSEKMSVVVLISGSGSNLQAILDAQNDDYPAIVSAVISNNGTAKGLQRAKKAGVPTKVISHRDFENRDSYDQALIKNIDSFSPGLVVLAGFMRILGKDFVNHYKGRLLNIHPSLLPLYPGLHTHQQALDAGDTRHGATVHFVTEELDGGPRILQATVPVLPSDNAETLARRVLEKEHLIYPRVIEWFASGRLQMQQGQAVFDHNILEQPVKTETVTPT